MLLIFGISQNKIVKLQFSKIIVLLCNLFINFNFIFLLHRSCLLKFCNQVLFLNVEIIHCFFWKIPPFKLFLFLIAFLLNRNWIILRIVFFLINELYLLKNKLYNLQAIKIFSNQKFRLKPSIHSFFDIFFLQSYLNIKTVSPVNLHNFSIYSKALPSPHRWTVLAFNAKKP